jgi:hypothetical protein
MGFIQERISRRTFLKVLGASGVSLTTSFLSQNRESEAYIEGLEPETGQPNFDQIGPTKTPEPSPFTPGPDGKYRLALPGIAKDGGELPLPKTWKRPEWPREVLVQPVKKGPVDKPKVAITIDDGWGFARDIAEILARPENHDVTITTFLVGRWMQGNPDTVRRLIDLGHEVGNHGAHHWTLTNLSDEGLKEEILGCEDILKSIAGPNQTTKPFLRPSGGVFDGRVAEVCRRFGF